MKLVVVFALLFLGCTAAISPRSSHSEAPGTSKMPYADITDLYAFKSYETGKSAYAVFLLNSIPLESPNAGPNYYSPSDRHFFELNIDNTGDCVEDLIIQWYNGNALGGNIGTFLQPDDDPCSNGTLLNVTEHEGIKIPIGNTDGSNTTQVAVALKVLAPTTTYTPNGTTLNWYDWFQMNLVRGDRATGLVDPIQDTTGNTQFPKPFDYAGTKSFPSYATYANSFIRTLDIPGCTPGGGAYAARVFVGQRKESFSIALGKVFDLVNFVPVVPGTFSSAPSAGTADCPEHNELSGKNVLTYALEIHEDCIKGNTTDVIGVWATTRDLTHVGADHIPGRQVSRLGNPLVNELVIGINDKAKFTIATPTQDGEFLIYVQYPTMPAILTSLFLTAVNSLTGQTLQTLAPRVPRADLVTVFLEGVPGLTQFPTGFTACEYMRLNLTVAPKPTGQNNLGVIAGDDAGYPNGRRPGDDIVDITLRVVMGVLCTVPGFGCNATDAPVGSVPFTDGSPQNQNQFDATFPFLQTPNPGSTAYAGTDATVCIGTASTGTGGGTATSTVGDGCSSGASALSSWLGWF